MWWDKLIPMLGETIRRLREEKGMTQKKFSQRIGIANSTVNLYETGERYPSLTTLVSISRVLGVSTDYLLGLDSNKSDTVDVSGLTPEEVHVIDMVVDTIRNRHLDKE